MTVASSSVQLVRRPHKGPRTTNPIQENWMMCRESGAGSEQNGLSHERILGAHGVAGFGRSGTPGKAGDTILGVPARLGSVYPATREPDGRGTHSH